MLKSTLLVTLFTSCIITTFADGLPGEHYVTQRWRDLFAGHSPATNPAFMTEENFFTARMALCPTLQNTFVLMEMGAIVPLGLYQSVGFTYIGLNSGEDLHRSYYNYDQDEIVVTDVMVNDNQNLIIVSYAVNPIGRMSIGANVNLFQKANFGNSQTSLCIDLAMSYRFLRHPVLGDHVVGINIQNLLSPDIGFKEFHNETANMKVSWFAKLWERRIEFGIDLDIKDFMAQGEDFASTAVSGGAPKQIEVDFNSRLGFWLMNIMNIYVQAGSNYWGVCPGFNVPTINNGRDLQIAYQFMSIVDDIDLTSSHTLYFRGDFGKHREEIYARKMARRASLGPTQLYNKARTLYSQGKYWDAFFIFGKILVEYPDFFKNDWVQLHMGLCQEQLDMREFSTENYAKTKKSFPRSVVTSYADLGLMRIAFRDNNSLGVTNQFARLNTASTPDSIKFHAYYYMGLQHQRIREHRKAIQLFKMVPDNHPEFIFAQLSLGVAFATENNIELSVNAFNDVIQAVAYTNAQQEAQNRAFTFMGYVFYEGLGGVEQSLQQAVAALRKVPPTSYYYEDAQIGLAWSAFKASQWPDCLLACETLIKSSKKIPLLCEAMLLKGYVALVTMKFDIAVAALSSANELIKETSQPSEIEKSAKVVEYDEDRATYYEIASRMNDYGYSGQSSYILREIDSLHVSQITAETKVRSFARFKDEFARNTFFARPVMKLREDLEYLLAKAEKMANEGKEIKIKDNAGEQIEKIDDEMKKLKEELEKLEQ